MTSRVICDLRGKWMRVGEEGGGFMRSVVGIVNAMLGLRNGVDGR